jgi:hypothetical protein
VIEARRFDFERIVAVSMTALTGNEAANKMPARLVAREAR